MGIDAATAVNNLLQGDPCIVAAVVIEGGQIVYSTDNWDISDDYKKVVSGWTAMTAKFIMISGVKYSMLAQTPEGFTATSYKGEGHIVGGQDDERKIIIYLEPDGNMLGASPDVQKTLRDMSSGATYMDANSQFGQEGAQMAGAASAGGGGGGAASAGGGASVDPQLKGEIQGFLDWIKDSEGLSGYISYYLQQNNAQVITELAKLYAELRQIFGV